MADAMVPASGPATAGDRLTFMGPIGERASAFMRQPAIRRALPALAGFGALGLVGALYLTLAEGPQRILYSSLSDQERAGVVSALDAGGINYNIDADTGTLSVGEDDLYRARMLVAQDGGLANPDNTIEILDSMPLGSSRTLEGERLRNVREQELIRSIQEINGVESARVHLASPERSVFVRENAPPSASVMLRLARGRSLTPDQVQAIVNLVSGSVPGLSPDAVRVVDQQGRLLSDASGNSAMGEAFELQREFEDKLRIQVGQLLAPMLGDGNFSSEVQVELDMSEVTRAQESYDNEGVLRAESETSSTQLADGAAGGVPGVEANTPPPPAVLEEGAPEGGAAGEAAVTNDQNSSQRTYELGREVAVTSSRPGSVQRISVAVAVSAEALEAVRPATTEQIEQLVAAAVGADLERGDAVTVVAGAFDPIEEVETPFYETSWFGLALRYGLALLVVLLALLFVVKPIMRGLTGDRRGRSEDGELDDTDEAALARIPAAGAPGGVSYAMPDGSGSEELREQVQLARRLANEQPDRAVTALRRMLAEPAQGTA